MVALVAAETVLLVLLLVLVVGLLRSHAEILRRLGPPEEDGRDPADAASRGPTGLTLPPGTVRGEATVAPAITGATPQGDALTLDFSGPAAAPSLLAFLTSGCSTCMSFWETLAEPRLPAEVRVVIVTHGTERERPVRLRSLAPVGVPVVMCSAAWEDYRIPGAPYFVLIDGTVRGEGAATTWQALASLVGDALEEQRAYAGRSAGTRRGLRVDSTLAAGGIGPGHPSLYPGRADGGDSQ